MPVSALAVIVFFMSHIMPMVDELIADLYVLDDITRRDLFDYAKMLKKNHTSPERAADLKDIK